jgi:hypothetical protein
MSFPGRKLSGGSTIRAIAIAVVFAAGQLGAQNPKTDLTLAGGTITFPAPTAADYVNGFVNSTTGVTFTLDATNGNQSHTTTILIRATSANLGNGKLLGDLQWRRSDLAGWNSISTTNVQVEQRVQVRGGANDPWGNTIFFRMALDWTKDAPGTYAGNYQITLSQTVP